MSTSTTKLLVSGLYSGPSPSAGLGVARSIRAAFPDLQMTGMDYWSGSSGLHHEVFNDVVVLPGWDHMDMETHISFLKEFLDQGGFYLPTLDLEALWIAKNIGRHPGILSPDEKALSAAAKPYAAIVQELPFSVPEILVLDCTDAEVHDFCRRNGWRVWLKGPYHDAFFVNNWRTFETHRSHLKGKWATEKLFLQAHRRGIEESICFAAVNGELIDAIYMKKRVITPEGKTWSGKITPLDARLRSIVTAAVARTNWHGGAEIELLRDTNGEHWFMEMNPRFPAWIYGSTIAGCNLPAKLFAAASGQIPVLQESVSSQFTRIVTEIPVRDQLSLPLVAEPMHGQVSVSGKYAAGMSSLVSMIQQLSPDQTPILPVWDGDDKLILSDVGVHLNSSAFSGPAQEQDIVRTPERIVLKSMIKKNFDGIRQLLAANKGNGFTAGYSLKTTSDDFVLTAAKNAGMMAECISMLEVKKALAMGWQSSEVILNGPAKWWPLGIKAFDGLYAVFADSLEEYARLVQSQRQDKIWGIRLKIPGFHSRFGIDISSPENFSDLCELIKQAPEKTGFGIHLHLAANLIGNSHWHDAVESALVWALNIESATGKTVSVFDLGGGYHPQDLPAIPWPEIVSYLHSGLKGLQRVIIEPGRALTQDAMAIVSTVVDVRRRDAGKNEIVVDTCIAELPLIGVYPHRFYFQKNQGSPMKLGRGDTRVLGRICMEDDVIAAGLNIPADVVIGDRIIIGDAGAYERSMSYDFGRGGY